MKFLLYSQSGEGAQILKRIELEGNKCALYIKDKEYKSAFDGLLEKTENPDDFIDDDTIIIFDMSGNGSIADSYRKSEHHVYGASEFSDKLEHDREFGFDIMEKAGIKIPEYKVFNSIKDGMDFVRETNRRLVFKPSGDMPSKLTYSSAKNSEELLAYMTFVEKRFGKHIKSFVLQDFIEGEVISSEFFCDGNDFIWPPNSTVEVKRAWSGDLGPSTGCSGNITWIENNGSKIIGNGIALMREICQKEQFCGQIDLNTVVNEVGVYGIEFTPRFGYDATPTLLTLLDDDIGYFFSGIAKGEIEEFSFADKFAGGIRVTIPPYPVEPQGHGDIEKLAPNIGVPILGWKEYQDSLYFYEVSKEDNQLFHSGGTGVIACAMGIGDNPLECLVYPYDILEGLVIPDKQYRVDLHNVLPGMVEKALKLGKGDK